MVVMAPAVIEARMTVRRVGAVSFLRRPGKVMPKGRGAWAEAMGSSGGAGTDPRGAWPSGD